MGAVWSINERLAGNPGRDFPPPALDWMSDLLEFAEAQAEELEDIRARAEADARGF